MNIVITGGRGFLGTHVAYLLREQGIEVTALGRRDGDLRNPFVAHTLLKHADTIIHLAADVGGLVYLRDRPAVGFHDNHQMGLNVITAACEGQAERLILASTPCSYSADSPLPLREQNLDRGVPSGDTGNYGFAKLAISKTAETVCPLHGVEAVTVIPANLYGPHDNFSKERAHVTAALLRKAVVAKAVGETSFEVWGNGSATRDFVYVGDVAAGIVSAATAAPGTLAGRSFNLASGQETSMRQLAYLVAETVGGIPPRFTTGRPVGYTHRVMSIDEAKRVLGFTASTSLADGLAQTLQWLEQSGTIAQWIHDAETTEPAHAVHRRNYAA